MHPQLTPPTTGDPLVTLHTTLGDITLRLFPEQAPKAAENFMTHATNGYYTGTIFHRVIDGFMIQGGDPQGTGRGGESVWGAPFEDECVPERRNFRGALSMANAGPCTNGSQFFIVQAPAVDERMIAQMRELGERGGFPPEAVEAYETVGGTPHLDFRHTVFGQVCAGMEVVDAIAAARTGRGDKPATDIVITGAEVSHA